MYLAAKNLTDKVTIDYMFLCKQNKTNGKKCSKYHGITAFCAFSCKIDFFFYFRNLQYELVITNGASNLDWKPFFLESAAYSKINQYFTFEKMCITNTKG